MNYQDPKKIALTSSIALGVFYLILSLVFIEFFKTLNSYMLVLTLFLIVAFNFFVVRFFLDRFIYDRIRLIYKAIYSFKRKKGGNRSSVVVNANTLDDVYKEVLEWQNTENKEIEELRRMESYRREFIGNISHELKTPIFNIQGYVLTLLDGGLEDKTINREYLLRTEKSINRMIAIVEDLEEISKLESGELQLHEERFDLLELVRDTIDFMEMKAKKYNAYIYFASNYDRPIYVRADKKKIRQVLINLIDNSFKYGNKIEKKTKISFFDMDEHILVEISDNGIGIDEKDLPRVFERFFRVDKGRSRQTGGTGLGLSIVKHIVEAHSQVINARSKLEVGTTFGFTLKNDNK
ncbi:MAG: sensor histidine kinase [Bacteroidales bacterium]